MNNVILCIFERDPSRQNEQSMIVISPTDDENPIHFDERVEAEAAQMARRFGADCYIFTANSKATIPIKIEEVV